MPNALPALPSRSAVAANNACSRHTSHARRPARTERTEPHDGEATTHRRSVSALRHGCYGPSAQDGCPRMPHGLAARINPVGRSSSDPSTRFCTSVLGAHLALPQACAHRAASPPGREPSVA
ncbi:hypothetical protein EI94DRAFT_94011 [Lactarius quietus]|nr:hypothetical protein EI94DRAFT_94011 [Lactarius quietus]